MAELIRVGEAAAILGTSRSTVHYLIGKGLLTALHLPPSSRLQGRTVYLNRAEVERLAADGSWRIRARRGSGKGGEAQD